MRRCQAQVPGIEVVGLQSVLHGFIHPVDAGQVLQRRKEDRAPPAATSATGQGGQIPDAYPTRIPPGQNVRMGKLTYHLSASLDGYIADRNGNFDFSQPDEEVHAFVNDLQRDVGTYLFGRNMYEVMSVWETWDTSAEPAVVQDFARIWHGADKVVYSSTLPAASTARTRIERTFDPEAVRGLKAGTESGIGIGGPILASAALQAGLVDECSLFVTPYVVGGGRKYFPDGLNLRLQLLEEHTFGSGTVYLRYRVLP